MRGGARFAGGGGSLEAGELPHSGAAAAFAVVEDSAAVAAAAVVGAARISS